MGLWLLDTLQGTKQLKRRRPRLKDIGAGPEEPGRLIQSLLKVSDCSIGPIMGGCRTFCHNVNDLITRRKPLALGGIASMGPNMRNGVDVEASVQQVTCDPIKSALQAYPAGSDKIPTTVLQSV